MIDPILMAGATRLGRPVVHKLLQRWSLIIRGAAWRLEGPDIAGDQDQ